jgi:hypothetical protein
VTVVEVKLEIGLNFTMETGKEAPFIIKQPLDLPWTQVKGKSPGNVAQLFNAQGQECGLRSCTCLVPRAKTLNNTFSLYY